MTVWIVSICSGFVLLVFLLGCVYFSHLAQIIRAEEEPTDEL